MYDNEQRYSLCLSYYGKNGKLLSYRIADYIPEKKEFVRATYTDKYNAEFVSVYEPAIIGSNLDELTLNEVEIRSWIPSENDRTKQRSRKVSNLGDIYEIVYPSELHNKLSDTEIKQVLKTGITIEEMIPNFFLLQIGFVGDQIRVLKCKKSDFVKDGEKFYVPSNVKDMLHDKHYLEEYWISRAKIVSTKELEDQLYEPLGVHRSFYNQLTLGVNNEIFNLRNAEDYIMGYFGSYLKSNRQRYELTKKETNRIVDIVNNAFSSNDEMEKYLSITGISVKDFEKAAQVKKDSLIEYFKSDGTIEEIVKQLAMNDESIYESCISVAQNRWMAEADHERDSKNKELLEIDDLLVTKKTENLSLEKKSMHLKSSINELEKMQDELKSEIKKLEIQKNEMKLSYADEEKELKIKIQKHLQEFKNNVVHMTETMGIIEAYNQVNDQKTIDVMECERKSWIYKSAENFKESKSLKYSVESIDEFQEILSENLSGCFCGVKDDSELAAWVISVLLSKKAIAISEYSGKKVADALAALVDGKRAEYFSIPKIDFDMVSLIDKINLCEGKVIYLDGLFNLFDENTVVTICRNCEKKFLFFGTNSTETLKGMSRGISNYVWYVDSNSLMQIQPKEKIMTGHIDMDHLEIEGKTSITEEFSKWKKMIKVGVTDRESVISICEILSFYRIFRKKTIENVMSMAILTNCRFEQNTTNPLLEEMGINLTSI